MYESIYFTVKFAEYFLMALVCIDARVVWHGNYATNVNGTFTVALVNISYLVC